MSSNIRKLNNIVQRSSIFLKDQNFSKLEKVYYPFVSICTIGGFAFGCKKSLDNIKSYKNIEDKISITTLNLCVGTVYGIFIGVCAPITIPVGIIISYNEIRKKFN
jgi:hypothetical protein